MDLLFLQPMHLEFLHCIQISEHRKGQGQTGPAFEKMTEPWWVEYIETANIATN